MIDLEAAKRWHSMSLWGHDEARRECFSIFPAALSEIEALRAKIKVLEERHKVDEEAVTAAFMLGSTANGIDQKELVALRKVAEAAKFEAATHDAITGPCDCVLCKALSDAGYGGGE